MANDIVVPRVLRAVDAKDVYLLRAWRDHYFPSAAVWVPLGAEPVRRRETRRRTRR